PLPPWLLRAFKARVTECEKRDEQGRPPLYAIFKKFWFEQQSTIFLLEGGLTSPTSLYNPRFFLWDPKALYKDLPCPICRRVLQRHATISRPRRCIDITSEFYIIGYRYRCVNCLHPQTKKKTVTFRSWDRHILGVLPSALAAEFPAYLSHRSGMSKALFSWMRMSFSSGMGAKRFTDALVAEYLLRYDELHLQYLDYIASNIMMNTWIGKKYQSFLPFHDTSPDGRHGFVPRSQWFRDMYDHFMEDHQHEFNQHTAMLLAEICAIDHSHKITKHVAKVNGERVFNGLLTVTNEKGEIRACNLVATKAHSQFEEALKGMRESLELYGHRQPELFYTDNMADKSFLESSFNSLRENVVPVEKYSSLEPFILPADVQIFVRTGDAAINTALSTIIDQVPTDDDGSDLVVGFDSEWNVILSDTGQHECGEIAIISDMVVRQRLPEKLMMLLQNPRVRKVGRMVNSDLKQLQTSVNSLLPFVGALDLANYAKQCHVVSNARCSLADLCATVLGKRLNKNVSERTSAAWEHLSLTTEQQHYAAIDAYVPLLLYHKLSTFSVPKCLPTTLTPLTPVLLFSTDNTVVVGRGYLSLHLHATNFDGVNLTKTRTLIEISEVLVPAAIISSHEKRSLKSFGSTPFSLVCLRSHLQIYDPLTFNFLGGITPVVQLNTAGPSTLVTSAMDIDKQSSHPQPFEGAALDAGQPDSEDGTVDGMGSLLKATFTGDAVEMNNIHNSSSGSGHSHHDIDLESRVCGKDILATVARPVAWDTTIRSRVLKDVFHVFNMLWLSTMHGLRKEFGRALRDILFVADKEDQM
ncbi:hypothetical protein BYT27DRAFT_7111482, partial [Phlegmacium glaucopus]